MIVDIVEQRVGYKHTALGWIPEDWEVKKLESIADVTQGISKGRNFVGKKPVSIPYLRVANVLDGRFDLQEIKEIELLEEDYERYLIKTDDILLTEGGDPDKLGRGGIWKNQLQGLVFQNHLFRIRSKRLIVLPDFLAYYVQGTRAKYYFLSCAKQTTGIASINSSQIKATPILLPPLPEQKAIADLLGTWDKAISTTTQLIARKEQRKKWLMQQLLTGKKRLPGFSGEWKEVRLGDVFDRVTRKNTEANTNVLTISGQRGLINQEDFFNKQVASELLDNYFLLRKGEFAYNKSYSNGYPMGAIKRLNKYDKGVVTTLYICFALKNDSECSPNFFEQYFEAGFLNRGLEKIAHEGGRAHGLLNVTPTDFFNLNLSIPSADEQAAIAKILQTADSEIQLLQQKLEKQQEQKKGLMQVLLTGKVRLGVKPDDGAGML
jgi:type I restriction enzyme, S subunit